MKHGARRSRDEALTLAYRNLLAVEYATRARENEGIAPLYARLLAEVALVAIEALEELEEIQDAALRLPQADRRRVASLLASLPGTEEAP